MNQGILDFFLDAAIQFNISSLNGDFGFFILKTNPGNCSGLYSVLLWLLASFVKETGFPKEVVATMFCTFKLDFEAILKLYTLYKENSFIKLSFLFYY